MILAILLDNVPPAFASKPSDVLGGIIYAGLFLLLTWVVFVVGKNFKAFMIGIAWVLGLTLVAIVLIAIFQAGHPGQ